MSENLDEIQKQTYNEHLDRTGYFCSICDKEVRNPSGLVTFESKESVWAINVCHECLPEGFE